MSELGIPYAFVDPDTGEVECPRCYVMIPESYDATGERLTNNYAEHYQKEHAK